MASEIFDEMTYGDEFGVLALAAFVFTVVNWVVKPIVTLLAIPLIILTFGIAYFFVNVLMLRADRLARGRLRGRRVLDLVGATIVIWLVNVVIAAFVRDCKRPATDRRALTRARLGVEPLAARGRGPVPGSIDTRSAASGWKRRLERVDEARDAEARVLGQVAGAAGADAAAVDHGHARLLVRSRPCACGRRGRRAAAPAGRP